ncbi:hypothetical protein [Streptomyces sp. NPDC002276]
MNRAPITEAALDTASVTRSVTPSTTSRALTAATSTTVVRTVHVPVIPLDQRSTALIKDRIGHH